jgi:glycerol-3-phosphate acyltransferase PlsY
MSLIFLQEPIVWQYLWLGFVCGYISGSVPYGLVLGQLFGLGDIRKSGSGNIGATNVLRVGGKKLAIATLLLDALKGAIPVLVAKQFGMDYAMLAGLGAIVGHLFPVWLMFKGGKGVATSLGVTLALSWQLGLVLCLIWLLVALAGKYSSLAALVAVLCAPLAALLITGSLQIEMVMAVMAVMVTAKHHANIKRLLSGTESKINLKRKETPAP